jgi:two-component system osmolarity sensor histidine kinase EnvZ
MNFSWLKRYMPRGIYGRAALILILPVVTMQLVVSVVFIQRHFEGVTEQLTNNLVRELNLVLEEMSEFETPEEALLGTRALTQGLDLNVAFDQNPNGASLRRWFDFSGIVVTRGLTDRVPGVFAVQLPDARFVRVLTQTPIGVLRVDFARGRVSASNPHQLLVNMVFFGGLMTLIAYIYLRNQLRPITRLATAAEAFGRGRKTKYYPAGAAEIRAAGQAFVDMRARIERHLEQRTLMLSGVSHDLRTPLTRLRLGLSLLEDAEREPLERDVEDMQRMLDEFLTFAKDAAEGDAEPTELGAFVGTIVDLSAAHGADVTLTPFEGECRLSIRRVAIQRALENLINNAVRYGSKALVSVIESEKQIVLRVDDDGPGIPKDQRDEAIKPFARLEAARNQNKVSGVGLGLSITADAARAHGGRLVLDESKTLGGLQADIVLVK